MLLAHLTTDNKNFSQKFFKAFRQFVGGVDKFIGVLERIHIAVRIRDHLLDDVAGLI